MNGYKILQILDGGDSMTIQEMNERKKELGYSYEKISELSGVPVGTVQKVLGGITKTPRYDTIYALEKVLSPYYQQMMVRDSAVTYGEKKQGEYTVEDYFALPDERRVELIDGVIYDMSSPTLLHQTISLEICAGLREYIRKKKGTCISGVAPWDVQLDCDNKTMVQPDVYVVCDKSKIRNGRLFGCPDFIVEVLSPSTAKKDTGIKAAKYAAAGVREYWIVDSRRERIIVYILNEEGYYDISLYTFHDEIPVAIFDNECKINFQEILDYIEGWDL